MLSSITEALKAASRPTVGESKGLALKAAKAT
jgi:hypothetical protein